jgi:hypothetical protein
MKTCIEKRHWSQENKSFHMNVWIHCNIGIITEAGETVDARQFQRQSKRHTRNASSQVTEPPCDSKRSRENGLVSDHLMMLHSCRDDRVSNGQEWWVCKNLEGGRDLFGGTDEYHKKKSVLMTDSKPAKNWTGYLLHESTGTATLPFCLAIVQRPGRNNNCPRYKRITRHWM